jgi:hypothetical protein
MYGTLGAGSGSTYASNGPDGNRQTASCFFVRPRMLETGYLAPGRCYRDALAMVRLVEWKACGIRQSVHSM